MTNYLEIDMDGEKYNNDIYQGGLPTKPDISKIVFK